MYYVTYRLVASLWYVETDGKQKCLLAKQDYVQILLVDAVYIKRYPIFEKSEKTNGTDTFLGKKGKVTIKHQSSFSPDPRGSSFSKRKY